jgi:hypothetical protein
MRAAISDTGAAGERSTLSSEELSPRAPARRGLETNALAIDRADGRGTSTKLQGFAVHRTASFPNPAVL